MARHYDVSIHILINNDWSSTTCITIHAHPQLYGQALCSSPGKRSICPYFMVNTLRHKLTIEPHWTFFFFPKENGYHHFKWGERKAAMIIKTSQGNEDSCKNKDLQRIRGKEEKSGIRLCWGVRREGRWCTQSASTLRNLSLTISCDNGSTKEAPRSLTLRVL